MTGAPLKPATSRERILRDMGLVAWARRESPAACGDAGSGPAGGRSAEPSTGLPAWEEMEAAVARCTRCALSENRRHAVFGVGSRNARWMIVGEAPGAREDRLGEPFVGRAGKLLDAMLAALGTGRDEVFITNIVKCRPPGNRDPKPEESAACRDYLLAQIEHLGPGLILALGRVAAQQLLGVETPVGKLRGRVHEGPGGRPLVVTYHPAYLLRTSTAKRLAWADLQLAVSRVAVRVS